MTNDNKTSDETLSMEDYKLIDLGLPSGTLWMDRNIGAKSPICSGLYFAWGETTGYTADEVGITKQFNWPDYKYCNSTYDKLNKYCNKPYFGLNGYTDNLIILQTTDDAAYQFTNGECQMPTKEQIHELIDNTTYQWTTQDGVKGGLFISKTNNNSIFVPAAGGCDSCSVYYVGKNGGLWSSSLCDGGPSYAWCLGFGSEFVNYSYNGRYFGFTVRGVFMAKNYK